MSDRERDAPDNLVSAGSAAPTMLGAYRRDALRHIDPFESLAVLTPVHSRNLDAAHRFKPRNTGIGVTFQIARWKIDVLRAQGRLHRASGEPDKVSASASRHPVEPRRLRFVAARTLTTKRRDESWATIGELVRRPPAVDRVGDDRHVVVPHRDHDRHLRSGQTHRGASLWTEQMGGIAGPGC